MNLCLDCNSYYERPGTCNCFAPGGKREMRIGSHTGETTQEWEPRPAPVPPGACETITVRVYPDKGPFTVYGGALRGVPYVAPMWADIGNA